MPTEPRHPECECGYDLSGLVGPPWTCPECNRENWPLPAWMLRRHLEGFTKAESRWFWGSIWATGVATIVTPWLPLSAWIVTVPAVMIGTIGACATWCYWLVKKDQWAVFAAIPLFVALLLTAATAVLALSAVSAVLAIFIVGP